MGIIALKALFFWCTVINGIILLCSSFVCAFARDWLYSIHNKFFDVSRETVSTMLYSFIALYKMLWIVFNLVPYIALLIMASN
jgi:hypothetical protein